MLRSEFTPVDLQTYAGILLGGAARPSRPVLITFDDGFIDNYEIVYPMLLESQVPATFFVVTGFVDGTVELIPERPWRAMNWDHVREMAASTVATFGAHTVTHRRLGTLPADQARWEVFESKRMLEENLRSEVKAFAYPFGQVRDMPVAALAAVEEAGFDLGFSTVWRTRNDPSRRHRLCRVMIDHDDEAGDVRRKLEARFDFLYFWHERAMLPAVASAATGPGR